MTTVYRCQRLINSRIPQLCIMLRNSSSTQLLDMYKFVDKSLCMSIARGGDGLLQLQ